MKLTYDPQYNVAYIQLRRKTGKVRTVRVSDEMNVDIAADGTIYGIELLDANRQLAKGKAAILELASRGAAEECSPRRQPWGRKGATTPLTPLPLQPRRGGRQ